MKGSVALLVLFLPSIGETQQLQQDLPRIHDVEFTGNASFNQDRLKKQLLVQFPAWWRFFAEEPRYQTNLFRKELARLEVFYLNQGFSHASARIDTVMALSGTGNRVDIRIHIHEGPRTILREVRYTPQDVFSLEELRDATPILPGQPYPFAREQIGRQTRALRVAFQTRGFLRVAVQDSTIFSPDSTEAVFIFDCQPGRQFRVNRVTVLGNASTERKLVERELEFRPGEVYNYQHIRESQQKLYNTGLFRRVTISEKDIDIDAGTVDLVVDLKERRLAFVEGSVGLGKRDETEARLVGRWGHRNLFGKGHGFEASSTAASNIENFKKNFFLEGRLRYVVPRLGGTQTRMVPQVSASNERRRSGVKIRGAQFDLAFSRQHGRYTLLGTSANFSVTRTSLETASDDLLQTRSFVVSISRNSADNIFDPRRGELRALTFQVAGFGGDNFFLRQSLSYAVYRPIGNSMLAFGVRSGYVAPYGSSSRNRVIGLNGVPFNFLFEAGGNTTVRGFKNESLGVPVTTTRLNEDGELETSSEIAGTVLLIANVELRMPFPFLAGSRLGSVLFLDSGNVWKDWDGFKTADFGINMNSPFEETDMRYSYGFGVRYATPFGPVRFDFAIPLKRSASSFAHFGLGHTF